MRKLLKILLLPCPVVLAIFLAYQVHPKAQGQNFPGGGANLSATSLAAVSLPLTTATGASTSCSTGLIAHYQFFVGDVIGSDTDGSGCGNNVSGTAGTAPTIAATTGGLVLVGAGAVKAPAAVNSALTIMALVSFQPNAASCANQAIWVGNGNGGTSGTTGMLLTSNNAASDPIVNNCRPWTIKNGSNAQATYAIVAGVADVADVMTSTAYVSGTGGDSVAVNGQFQSTNPLVNASSAAGQTTGVFQVGGAAAGSGFASQTYMTGTIIDWAAWGSLLTQAQVMQAHTYFENEALNRGFVLYTDTVTPNVNPAFFPADQNQSCMYLGDSITAGSGVSFPFPLDLTLATPCTNSVSSARSGATSIQLLHDWNTAVGYGFRPAGTNWVNVFMGTNDSGQNTCGPTGTTACTAQFSWGDNSQACTRAIGLGAICFVDTMLSRTSQDTYKDALNPLIRGGNGPLGIYTVDFAEDPNIGADGASANTTYFQVDHIHPTQFSNYEMAGIFNRVINRALGHRDFQSATTYTTGTAGSVTTTAGSEVGDLVTLTAASWPIGNFAPGTIVKCSGITPTGQGYNTAYPGALIVSNGGTTITFHSTPTGLGVITGNGTCSGVMQQGVDQTIILGGNGAVSNFLLDSCIGLPSNLPVVIKGADATAAWTVTPYDTETIDGSATVAVLNKATLILQPVLTGNTTGNCTWKQLQNN